jgi:hypothetical protein
VWQPVCRIKERPLFFEKRARPRAPLAAQNDSRRLGGRACSHGGVAQRFFNFALNPTAAFKTRKTAALQTGPENMLPVVELFRASDLSLCQSIYRAMVHAIL